MLFRLYKDYQDVLNIFYYWRGLNLASIAYADIYYFGIYMDCNISQNEDILSSSEKSKMYIIFCLSRTNKQPIFHIIGI